MSTAFITPSGEQLQSLAFYNELQLAYSERRQAGGQSAADPFTEGAYWQKLSMYQGWQNWMEANCTLFLDSSTGVVQLNPDGTDFKYFTPTTWRAAAGLNASGFSRYDKDGNFIGYGIAQDDDAICDKTFLELQAGFGALKWTAATPWSEHSDVEIREGDDRNIDPMSTARPTLEDAYNKAVQDWNNNDWKEWSWPGLMYWPGAMVRTEVAHRDNWGSPPVNPNYECNISRYRIKYHVTQPNFAARSIELWGKETAPTIDTIWQVNPTDRVFYDHGDTNITEIFKLRDTYAEGTDNPVSFDYLSGTDVPECPADPGETYTINSGYNDGSIKALVKWGFTNA